MKQASTVSSQGRTFSTRIRVAVGLLFALALFPASASASYEQVSTFPPPGSEGSNFRVTTTGLAVNVSGAGGASTGTLYAITGGPSAVQAEYISRYSPKGEFLGRWFAGAPNSVAIDQATGNVYVLRNISEGTAGVVNVYSADGTKLIASFGEAGVFNESVDVGPGKTHLVSGIAVDDSGVVYVSDRETNGNFASRVMVFEPENPGDYEHYIYAGRANDVAPSDATDPVSYLPQALAVDAAGNLYFGGESAGIYEFDPNEPASPICNYKVSGGGIQGVTVNPESGEPFYFTYKHKSEIFQLSACNPQGEFSPKDTIPVAPKADEMKALAFNPALSYEALRPPGVLYGVNSAEVKVGSETAKGLGYIFAPAEVFPPSVESESVSSVTSTTVTLGAQINPKGSITRYVFQYLTEAEYEANEPAQRFAGAKEAPLGGAVLGSGKAPLTANASLFGLQPDTAYRFRAVATSNCEPENPEEVCEDSGEGGAFRTFPVEAPGLPDNRAWELVSPAQKNGGEVFPATPLIGTCGPCKPAGVGIQLFPMQSSPNGESVVYEGFPFSTTEGARIANEYLSKRTASGWQTKILSPLLHTGNYEYFDDELTKGVLEQVGSLSPEAPVGYDNLYAQPTATPSSLTPLVKSEPPNRYIGSGTDFKLALAGTSADLSKLFFEANDALTPETPFAPEAVDGGQNKNNLYRSEGGQLALVNVLPGNTETVAGAVFGSGERLSLFPGSPDYSHAISEDGSYAFWSDQAGQVYVRVNGESTIEIPDSGEFITASADGSKVLLDSGHVYDLQTEAITDLTEGEGGFQGITGQSEDLSHIYFVDTAVLSEGENEYGAKAKAGKFNLYSWQGGEASFIATLASNTGGEGSLGSGSWVASPAYRTSEASPDGRWAAFISSAPLTGYDNTGLCTFDAPLHKYVTGACTEVFLYDSATGRLSCASCNPSGVRPLGSSYLRLIERAKGANPQPRYLTDSGRLYFDSRDSLTPFDTNNGVEDVYQYEPQGVGQPPCQREAGCVNLISAGHEPIDSNFLAADATGENVFFTTRDQLVLKDRDDLIDVYDARENGGIASETETSRAECQGEACVAALSPPNDPTPGSSSFEGAGNVEERKAAKKHKKKHKKHAKKAHRKQRAANHNRGGAK